MTSQKKTAGFGGNGGQDKAQEKLHCNTVEQTDKAKALEFLNCLDASGAFTFQTFDDDKDRKSKSLIKVLNGNLDQHWGKLCEYNDKGAGVFVTINETDLKGRKLKNITRVRGLYADFDSADIARIEKLDALLGEFKPTIIIESSEGKHHYYWLCDGLSLDEFQSLQKALIAYLDKLLDGDSGIDTGVHDLPRVMRLTGFFHNKDTPFLSRVIRTGERVEAELIRTTLAAYINIPKPKPAKVKPVANATVADPVLSSSGYVSKYGYKLHDVLRFIPNNDLNYDNDWQPLLAAIHAATAGMGSNEAYSWSSNSAKHEDGKFWQAWNSFGSYSGKDADWGSLIDTAKANGMPDNKADRARIVVDAAFENLDLHPDAKELAAKINYHISEAFGFDVSVANPGTISELLNGCFWNGVKSKLYLLNTSNALVQFAHSGAFRFLQETFGFVVPKALLDVELARFEDMHGGELSDTAKTKVLKQCSSASNTVLMDYILLHRQRDSAVWNVDMFRKKAMITLENESVNIDLVHNEITPKVVLKKYDPLVVADYKEHFTRLDEILEFIVAARFAKDRKQAYLWLHASSDWGKSFFIGLLDKMGLAVEMSIAEIERALEGSPVGKNPADFLRAFVLVIEEFKNVKSEVKQLESSIAISPKNQPESRVPIFAKFFLSANTVQGLVSENGVEEQFANRFSYFKETGNLSQRPMFRTVGKSDYHDSVTLYAAEQINARVRDMVALGEREAARKSETFLADFIGRYGLGNTFGRFDATLPELAGQAIEWLLSQSPEAMFDGFKVSAPSKFVLYDDGQAYLSRSRKALSEFINEICTPQEAGALYPVIPELIVLMCADGVGVRPMRVNGKPVKVVKLKMPIKSGGYPDKFNDDDLDI